MAAPLTAGLDIGATCVRAVEVRRTRTRPMIERFEQVPLPDGAVVGGVVKDEKAVTAAIKQLKSRKMFGSGPVALAVTHQQVVVREMEVPRLPADQLRQALPHLAREVMPLAVDEAVLDFVPLGRPDDATGDTVRGLLTAAPREAVTFTVGAVEKAGLHVERVDLACFAVLRAVAALAEGAEVVVDIGANATLFVVHTGGVPQLVRTIPRGGRDVTAALCRRLGTTVPDAEDRKRRFGLAADPADPDYREAITDAVRPLVSEIRSSVGYWVGNHGAPLGQVSLVGGGSRLRGLPEELTAALGVPTVLGNPLQYLGSSRRNAAVESLDPLGEHRASAAVSVGLTLGAAS